MSNDGKETTGSGDIRGDYIGYDVWGVEFFQRAVTAERVLGAVNNLAGQPIDFGPMGVGPGQIAKITAKGKIGQALSHQVSKNPVTYRVLLPVSLDFTIDLQLDTHRFQAELEVPLVLTARALTGLRIFVEVAPPASKDVTVKLKAEGLRASLIQRVVPIENELRRFVAKYVAREVTKPHIASSTLIDVASAIDGAYSSINSKKKQAKAAPIADLNDALESEIRENEAVFLVDPPT